MPDYDSIRPFHDHEVPSVVDRVVNNPGFGKAAARLVMPGLFQDTNLGEWISAQMMRLKTRNLRTVDDCQLFIADYFERLVNETIDELSVSGLEQLDKDGCYLFISNHRDIVMDSSLLNFLMHQSGYKTCRMAVGDNLLTNSLAADLMRLNKSFVVERSVSGAKATLAALTRTSTYIRHSLEEDVSIWIAQRQGRAKDGWDRTDPTLLKMLALAYRDTEESLEDMLVRTNIVPVSISYELDPCALRKAHELSVVAKEGVYDKSEQEDLQSIVMGMVGKKGRVHLHFNAPMPTQEGSPDEVALNIDRAILSGMRIFPTYVAAAARMDDAPAGTADVQEIPEIMERFAQQIADCPIEELDFLLLQYANVLRNREDLGIVSD